MRESESECNDPGKTLVVVRRQRRKECGGRLEGERERGQRCELGVLCLDFCLLSEELGGVDAAGWQDKRPASMSGFQTVAGGKRELLPGKSSGGRVPACEACLSMRQHNNDRFLTARALLLGNTEGSTCCFWGESSDREMGAAGEGSSARRRRRRRSSGISVAGALALALAACCPVPTYG